MLGEIRKINNILMFLSVSTVFRDWEVNNLLTHLINALMKNPGFYEEPALSVSVHEAT